MKQIDVSRNSSSYFSGAISTINPPKKNVQICFLKALGPALISILTNQGNGAMPMAAAAAATTTAAAAATTAAAAAAA